MADDDEFDEDENELDGWEDAAEELYEQAMGAMYDSWADSSQGFNGGQLSIYNSHITSALDEAADALGGDWPFVSAGDYVDILFGAYDGDVMERAFSEAIYAPVDQIEDCIQEAQAVTGVDIFFNIFKF